MGLTAKQSAGGSFNPAPTGTFVARCVQVIDLGTQYSEYYQKSAHKLLIGWELPTEMRETQEGEPDEPYLVWRRYTLSLHQNSALRAHLENWRNKTFTREELDGFDLTKILDKPCMINITHTDNNGATYANVGSVMAVPKGTSVPDRHYPLVRFDIDDWNDSVFDTFSDNLKETIKNSAEYRRANSPTDAQQLVEDEEGGYDGIPF